ncbi:integrin alpha-X-like [Carcharodon carcharias]|uniref:integrin alpha-X-like n=1 Tax=Carcharodon carcharias TaxID=13397 RepID=UPI001B7F2527|nr:integrin alpha-X-like [Carcharodon carcharias]
MAHFYTSARAWGECGRGWRGPAFVTRPEVPLDKVVVSRLLDPLWHMLFDREKDKHWVPQIDRYHNNLFPILQLPFEKNCGQDGVCIANLDVKFISTGADILTVHVGAQLNLTVQLKNLAENSYRTAVEFNHPHGITFRKVTIIKSNRKVPVACTDSVTREDRSLTNCNISHPVFAQHAEVTFILTLDVSNSETWSHSILLNVTSTSENEDASTLQDNRASLDIAVRHRVNLLVRSLDSTSYLNFSLTSLESKEVVHRYKVENLFGRPVPVNVTFIAAQRTCCSLLWDLLTIKTEQPKTNQTRCAVLGEVRGHTAAKGNWTGHDCRAESCWVIHCTVDQLAPQEPLTFVLWGYLSLSNMSQAESRTYDLQSGAWISFDQEKYQQAGDEKNNLQFLYANVTTHVDTIKEVDYIPYISGGAVGGLLLLILAGVILWKAGFFKRKFKDQMAENVGLEATEDNCSEPLNKDSPAT